MPSDTTTSKKGGLLSKVFSSNKESNGQKKKLQKLPTLDLSNKKFGRFPLQELHEKGVGVSAVILDKNDITSIAPSQFFDIAHATWKHSLLKLSLAENQLVDIPREIGLLTNIRHLVLDNNNLTQLPVEITKLRNLEVLSIKNNNLSKLPDDWSGLVNLRELHLAGNLIACLPRSLAKLEKLNIVTVKGNPIVYPPPKTVGDKDSIDDVAWSKICLYLDDPMSFIKNKFAAQVKALKPDISVPETANALGEHTRKTKIVLADKRGRNEFAKFLEKECSLENLLFFEEVEDLFLHSAFMAADDFKSQCLLIYYKYISVEVPTDNTQEINLPYEIKGKCKQFFDNSYSSGIEEYKNILSLAQTNIFQLLSLDPFNRFVSTPEYQAIADSIAA